MRAPVLATGAGLAALALLSFSGTAGAETYDDAIQLATDTSSGYAATAQAPVIMSIHGTASDPDAPAVIVPGDHLTGTLHVKNAGPSAGTLRAYIVDTQMIGPDAPAMDNWFTGDVQASAAGTKGSVVHFSPTGAARPIGASGHEGVQVLEAKLAKGAETDVVLDVDFPLSATSGNSAGSGATKPDGTPNDYSPGTREARFSVYLTLGGEDQPSPTPAPSTPPTAPDSSAHPTPSQPGATPSETIQTPLGAPPRTGVEISLLAGLGALVLAIGLCARRLSRR